MDVTSPPASRLPLSAVEYYRDAAVRARVLEFCGATGSLPPTAAYVVVFDPGMKPFPTWDTSRRLSFADGVPWDDGQDLSRSLWDTAHLVFFIELDYLNVDQRDEPFRHPADVLVALEPSYQAMRVVLARFRLGTACFASGRGYHFVGVVPLDDPVVDELAALMPTTPSWWHTHRARRPAGVRAEISERQARAADGLGLLVEHAAHLVLRKARRSSPTPVVFNGTKVGRGLNGRSCVSIDFSHAGDPLDARFVRTGFSTYQWHRYRPDIFGEAVARSIRPWAVVPRRERALLDLLAEGRSLAAARRAAQATSGALPDVSSGVGELLAHYRHSRLGYFHQRFLHALAPAITAGSIRPLPPLPACGTTALSAPNDLLLQPAHLQHLTRLLLVRGWNPAHIAALVQSRYQADHAWGDRWQRLHAETRAAFDVRVFAGLVETGLDTLTDFNCVSAQEKDLCPGATCSYNLLRDCAELSSRRTA
jgi:hypothetical protein